MRRVVGVLAFLFWFTATAWAQPTGRVLGCPSGTLALAQAANGDSANWLDVGQGRPAITVLVVNTGNSVVSILNSPDGGVTFDDVDNSTVTNGNENWVIENPAGIFKANVSTYTTGAVTVKYLCSPGTGGRP